ncbi:MAG: hypothetical protein ABI863_24210 [Ginsengibacter sp.]
MEQTKELEDLHKQSLEKINEYFKKYLEPRQDLAEEHHEKLNEAKEKWQSSWTDFMDVIIYLETLEI